MNPQTRGVAVHEWETGFGIPGIVASSPGKRTLKGREKEDDGQRQNAIRVDGEKCAQTLSRKIEEEPPL